MSNAVVISASIGSDARAEGLVASFERAGYVRVAPAMLQPAEPFLDLSGEDICRRMYLTVDPQGRELCLRPDLTIPVSRDYLASPAAGKPQGFCYLGPVFRYRQNAPGEFLQAGIESFGRADKAAADAEMLALGLAATAHYGVDEPEIRIGDVALFAALIDGLDLASTWKRRLIKDFNHKRSLEHDLERLGFSVSNKRPEYQGVLAALTGSDPKAAHALVTDLLSIAGITAVGGRSVAEIADRFLEQAALGAQPSLPGDVRKLIEQFLMISGELDQVAIELRDFGREVGISLDAGLTDLETRTSFLAALGVDVSRINFSTAFGRGLDYYTGFVFELHHRATYDQGPLVAGGRYDGLLSRLGSVTAIPAVGFAVWIERLSALRGRT